MTRTRPPDLLWHSVVPSWLGGYANQSRLVVESLVERDITVDLSGPYDGSPTTFGGHRLWPSPDLSMQSLVLNAKAAFAGDTPKAIAFTDVIRLGSAPLEGVELAYWAPINFDPVPPRMLDVLRNGIGRILAMSNWASLALEREGVESTVIPCGVDLRAFRPSLRKDRTEVRQLVGVPPDAFVVGMVAANNEWVTNRKSLPESLMAFSELRRRHSDAVLYLHTDSTGTSGNGTDLTQLIRVLDLPRDSVIGTDPESLRLGLSPERMASMYQSFDVLLAPSGGEGFGIPVIEAQAVGVPVIVSDFSSQPELVGAGWIVDGQRRWVPPVGSWLITPSVPALVDALEAAYNGPRPPIQSAVDHAASFDHELVFDRHWAPVLADWEIGT